MATRLDVFDDFHLHGASAPEWEQRYVQLPPGLVAASGDAPPVHDLRGLRLDAARQRLPATPAAEPDVCAAAGDAGFEHLSHFSARCRALFGESPSQTLRRTAPP